MPNSLPLSINLAAAILLLSRNWWHVGYMAVGLLLILAVSFFVVGIGFG